MRKDVRLGAAIGGILIAVLIVYGIVVSKNQPKKPDVVIANDGGKPTSPGDATAGGEHAPGDAAPADHPDGTAAPDAPAPEAATPPAAPAAGAPAAPPVGPNLLADNTPGHAAAPTTHKPNWGGLLTGDVTFSATPAGDLISNEAFTTTEHHGHSAGSTLRSHDAGHTTVMSAAPGETPNTPALKTWVIKSGDTFSSIAKEVYGDSRYFKQIAKANPKVDPAHLRLGTRISLPDRGEVKHADATPKPAADAEHHAASKPQPATSATEYRVQSGDSLTKISLKLYHTPNRVDAIYQLNKAAIGADPAKLKLNMVLKLPEAPAATASR